MLPTELKNNVKYSSSWLEKAQQIKAASEYLLGPNFSFMTEFERLRAQGEIFDLRLQYSDQVINGAVSDWNKTVDLLKEALAGVESARAAEVRRWDAGKLSSEISVVRALVALNIGSSSMVQKSNAIEADIIERLAGIYHETKNSGDLYKRRAADEVYAGILGQASSDPETRLAFNRLAVEARADLEAVRTTPEIVKAHERVSLVTDELNRLREAMHEAAVGIGKTSWNGDLHESRMIDALARVRVKNGAFLIDAKEG